MAVKGGRLNVCPEPERPSAKTFRNVGFLPAIRSRKILTSPPKSESREAGRRPRLTVMGFACT